MAGGFQFMKKKSFSHRQEIQRILDAIRCIVRGLRVSSKAVEKNLGLSGAQLFVLQKLEDATTLSVNELAERKLSNDGN